MSKSRETLEVEVEYLRECLRKKNRKLKELEAELSKVKSDASWDAELRAHQQAIIDHHNNQW